MSGGGRAIPAMRWPGLLAPVLAQLLALGAPVGPLRADEQKPDIFILVEPRFVGFDLSKVRSATVECQVGAVVPGPGGYARSNVLGAGSLMVLVDERGAGDNELPARVTIGIQSLYGPGERKIEGATSYYCKLVYSCRDTEEEPRPVEPGDPLLANPATACLGFDAKRSPFSVSGPIPAGWD